MKYSEDFIRIFEDNYDLSFLPNTYIVARLDGRSFSDLTKSMNLEKPFDHRFQQIMCNVVESIMRDSGFNIIYGYTQSDEISFLFKFGVDNFSRRINKYISILSSLASSAFTFYSKCIVSFDCRISQLPSSEEMVDYFRWRQEDASRNCLNGYCFWKLREKHSRDYVINFLDKKSASERQEILFQEGINYNDIPIWQKRGTGFYWKKEEKLGINPLTKEETTVERNKLYRDLNISYGEAYDDFLRKITND